MENQNQTKKIPLGTLENLETNILRGTNFSIDINKLALFTGKNGTGKTLVLIQIWIVNYIAEVYLLTHSLGIGIAGIEAQLQYIFDKSFDKNDFTGKIIGRFPEGELE
jgi:hypothetical protein